MNLDVLIVTYNSSNFIARCLNSVFKHCKDFNTSIYVIDNASNDNTCEIVEKINGNINLTKLDKNSGFASGCNFGIRSSNSEFIMLINPDAFLNSNINPIIKVLNEKDVAVVGTKILNPDNSIQQSCYKFPDAGTIFFDSMYLTNIFKRSKIVGDYKYWDYSTEREVDWVIGACMFLKRKAVESIGLFDERFFLYGEETDLCLRLNRAGWKIKFCPEVTVTHIGKGSFSSVAQEELRQVEDVARPFQCRIGAQEHKSIRSQEKKSGRNGKSENMSLRAEDIAISTHKSAIEQQSNGEVYCKSEILNSKQIPNRCNKTGILNLFGNNPQQVEDSSVQNTDKQQITTNNESRIENHQPPLTSFQFNENVYKSISYYFTKHYGRRYLFLVNSIFFLGSIWRVVFSLPLSIFSEKYRRVFIYHLRRIIFFLPILP